MKKIELLNKIEEKYENEFIIITDIKENIDRNEYIDVKCSNGHDWHVRVRKMIEKDCKGCPVCTKLRKTKTTEIFKKEVKEIYGDEYSVEGEYINGKTHTDMKHIPCGHIYQVTPNNFLRGRKCPYCSDKKPARNTEWFKEQVALFEGYELLSEYIETNEYVTMKHIPCGHIYQVTPNNFLGGTRCPICSHRSYKKTTEEFSKEVEELTNKEYIVVSDYVNNKTSINIKHCKCNNIITTRPVDFIKRNGIRCSCEGESKGSKLIKEFLESNNIAFVKEYKFNDCKNIRPLPFDYYTIYNDEIILIEFDGEQHFYPIYGQERFESCKKNDNIKNQYCKDNNIKLIRISYKQLNKINSILKKIFK